MDFDQRQIRGGGGRPHMFERPGSDIKKSGYLKKLKTNKKKFFVLRSTSSSGPSRLEYYDSEKKFKAPNGQLPKRSIQLHTCFNINRQADSRHCKNGIVLYTCEDSFVVLADSSEEQEAWLNVMLEYQYEYLPSGDDHREHYEHVWSVMLQPKGLGNKTNKGQYRVCLNSSSISLIKTSSAKPQYVIQLPTIRNIAQSECSFSMEVGKYAPTGEGKFWFHVDDADIVKDMHSTLHHYMNNTKDPTIKKDTSFRARSESHSSMSPNHRRASKADQRPASFYTSGSSTWRTSMDTASPGSVSSSFGPADHILGAHRPRSDTGDSRISRGSSQHEDGTHDFFMTSYKNGDMHDSMKTKELNVVPPDMSPPPSPKMFEEYLEMDASIHSAHSAGSNSMGGLHHHTTSVSSPGSSSYMAMSPHSQSSSVKGDLSPSLPDSSPSAGNSYMSMAQSVGGGGGGGSHFGGHASAPIPIHPHITSHPPHPTPLPTVREGGSNEGYLPMDVSSSPATPSNLRPEPVKCMLSLDNDSPSVGLPPRTYSLGSKPVGKKYLGYMDMGVGGGGSGGSRKGSLSNDNMLRATSAPHIIHKGRRDRERERDNLHGGGGGTDSPIPSPLSMSIKSDDSDSFIEYMPMRPRTASDSYNYRPRTSSQGKLQPMCRPRSSSHGQGTRPITKFNSRISQDALQHRVASRDSSLHDSFDSLRVSNESLRRMSQDLRHSPVVNVSEQGDMIMRVNTPPPHSTGKNNNNNNSKNDKELVDSYMSMDLASNLHHHPSHKSSSSSSSPHRIRTDSSSSGSHRPTDFLASQDSDYTEMTPVGHTSRSGSYSSGSKVGGEGGDDYMNMGHARRPTPSPVLSTSLQSPSLLSDSAYVNMDLDGGSARRSESIRSASVENVESYIMFDPAPLNSGSKLRTGSVGSKDKKGSLRLTAASASKKSANGSHFQQPVNVSASTKKGGSSDSIRKPTRQSSMEKYGSLGKDFRKKSGSTGSRPMGASKMGSGSGGSSGGGGGPGSGSEGHHGHMGFNLVPIRKSTTPVTVSPWNGGVVAGGEGDPDDEYVEFSPNAYRDSSSNSDNTLAPTTANTPTNTPSINIQSTASGSHHHQQQALSNDDDYTPFAPAHNISIVHTTASTPTTNTPQQSIHHHHYQHTSSNDDDYTPFAPAHNISIVHTTASTPTTNTPQQSIHHHHYQHTSSNDDDYTPFAPAHNISSVHTTASTPMSNAPQPSHHLQHHYQKQHTSSNDDDYTPFAPAHNISSVHTTASTPTNAPQQSIPHHPHHPHHYQPSRQDDSDYTLFAPAVTSQNNKQISSKHAVPLSIRKQPPPTEQSSDYVGYDPSPRLPPSNAFPTLSPSHSYHNSSSSTSHSSHIPSLSVPSDILSRQKNPKVQHHSSLDSPGRRDSDSGVGSGSSSVHASTSLTFNPLLSKSSTGSSSSSSSLSNQQPRSSAMATLSLSSSSSYQSPSSTSSSSSAAVFSPSQALFSYAAPQPKRQTEKPNNEDDSEYLSYNPAQPKVSNTECSGESNSNPNNVHSSSGSLMKATSLIRNDQPSGKKSNTPLTVDVSSSSSLSSSSLSSPKKDSNNTSSNASQPKQGVLQQQQQLAPPSPLSCITTAYLSSCNTMTTTTSDNNTNHNHHKNTPQMSPSCHSSSPSPQPPSPLPTVSEDSRPWNLTAGTTNSSSSSLSTRQKHASGSSTSSQKSRRISGDSSSENINMTSKPLRKSSKSDSNSSLSSSSGSKNSNNGSSGGRRRVHSGDKTPQSSGSAEKSPLLSPSSRSTEEFFCGSPSQCSGKSLEAKMVPVESKIRHSVGDVTTLSSGGDGSGGGLIRPGSTPCFQQVDSESSSGSGSGGSVTNNTEGGDGSSSQRISSSSLSSGQQGASRSRHSLSDLGAYQQMSVGGSSLNESGSGGSGDSCGSGNASLCPGLNLQAGSGGKPLNYAQLDLSASGSGSSLSGGSGSAGSVGGSGSGGSIPEGKSRNLSDGDERQPPLSYAKIDFVKSQNMNKAMGFGGTGGGVGGDSNVSKT